MMRKMKTVLKLIEFRQNYHSFVVKLEAKFIRRGISVILDSRGRISRLVSFDKKNLLLWR